MYGILVVVVKNPADFIGGAVGVSEQNTKGILATTIGKVLVIDEASTYFLASTPKGHQSKHGSIRHTPYTVADSKATRTGPP